MKRKTKIKTENAKTKEIEIESCSFTQVYNEKSDFIDFVTIIVFFLLGRSLLSSRSVRSQTLKKRKNSFSNTRTSKKEQIDSVLIRWNRCQLSKVKCCQI